MSRRKMYGLKSVAMVTAIASAALIGGPKAEADVVSAQSEGYGLQVDLDVLNLLSIDLLNTLPGQVSAGAAQPAYSETASAIPANVTAGTSVGPIAGTGVNLDLATIDGVLNSTANSDVDGAPGSRQADAFGQVNGLDLGVVDASVTALGINTLNLDLVNVTAGTISSTAMVSGDAGSLTAHGDSIIQDLDIEVNGIALDIASLLGANGTIDGSGLITTAPNTTIVSIGGVTGLDLVLNQQIISSNSANDLEIEVNAVRLTFNGIELGLPLIDQALNGDIRIGHSQASMTAVPEPASLTLFACGLLALRRGKRTA